MRVTTVAPAPPEISPGLPPNIAATNPAMNAAYNPESGGNPAKIAKDNDSGIMVIATVNPANISTLQLIFWSRLKNSNTLFITLFYPAKLIKKHH